MSSPRNSDSSDSPTRSPSPSTLWENSELARLMAALGFETLTDIIDFIASEAVSTPFVEFVNDFLVQNGGFDDIVLSLDDIINSIMQDRENGDLAYNAEDPDKSEWTLVNHFARFIIQAYTLAQETDSTWQGVDEADFAVIAWQLYELLVFLSRRYLVTHPA